MSTRILDPTDCDEHAMGTKLTSKGQVTVPKRIRDELQLLPGTTVEFSVNRRR